MSKVIRIDDQVWAELKRRAEALEDTPNAVLRRTYGLLAADSRGKLDPRVAQMLELVQDLVGQTVQLEPDERGYAVLGRTGKVVAHIGLLKEQLRISTNKRSAEKAMLDNWDKLRKDRFFGGTGVRWFVQDDDDPAYERVAAVLATLWNIETSSRFQPSMSRKALLSENDKKNHDDR